VEGKALKLRLTLSTRFHQLNGQKPILTVWQMSGTLLIY